ncbi:CDP-alcohol phosphatidyltransferase family protein [Halarcobacter sp.]|uniref:CDP-alcohol phosphatidyltransferase family protein n=1 Tax=Halarcobacter sp. TaxID=2321133 RepID=UPI0029F55CE1|nr:CDP-alcohol phosphatidyltransferase family protein [Halarcobacter sp.]
MLLNQFHNKKVSEVFLLKLLYIFSSPLAQVFLLFNIKANTITTLSNISAMISYISIFYNFYFFFFFWSFSLILDICDGIVARATKTSSAAGSFYDHFSDFLKIMGLFLFIGIYYDTKIIWILVSLNLLVFSTVDYLDKVIHQKNALIKYNKINSVSSNNSFNLTIKIIIKINTFLNNLIIYRTFFIMHGQYNLILLPLAYNIYTAQYTLVLSFLICFWTITLLLIQIKELNNIMINNNIPWK